MDIKTKTASKQSEQSELQEYLIFQLMSHKSISAIVEYETLKDILDELEQYIDGSVNKYKCHIVEDEDDLYVITKEECDDYVILEVSSLFEFNPNEEDYDVKYIESDVVYIEDMEFNVCDELKEELENSICSDEIYNLYINDEVEDCEDKCECCNNNCEEDPVNELLNEYIERILETEGCTSCIRKTLKDMYMQVYKEALTNELLLQHDIVNDRLFGEDGLLN